MIWGLFGSLQRRDYYRGMMKYSLERRANRFRKDELVKRLAEAGVTATGNDAAFQKLASEKKLPIAVGERTPRSAQPEPVSEIFWNSSAD
jgi:hypothetical protein